jgi:hypothetical protein
LSVASGSALTRPRRYQGLTGKLTKVLVHPFWPCLDVLAAVIPEAGTGFIDRIQVTTPAAPVPGPIVGAGLPGLILAGSGLLGWWRRRKKIA